MVFEYNIASEKVLLKCGFSCEGTLRNVYRKNGAYITAKLMALVDPAQ
jgi:RimJ/RimL family protein N-acetyltransferase